MWFSENIAEAGQFFFYAVINRIVENHHVGGSMKKIQSVLFMLMIAAVLSGCGLKDAKEDKIRDIDFTVATEEELPEEFLSQIDDAKSEPFQLTYMDQGYLYIAVGFGKQDTSGYSIRINECSEGKTQIRFRTELVGPEPDEKTVKADTWPWIAVKMEETDKSVIFQ